MEKGSVVRRALPCRNRSTFNFLRPAEPVNGSRLPVTAMAAAQSPRLEPLIANQQAVHQGQPGGLGQPMTASERETAESVVYWYSMQ